ncbi:MAG: T9SS type A sorting domain-containing protein [Sphingobacteriales bacterium]|nr:MAG: T9SS type A sorting domain-containing protein [Sphingobacteriales bacterium]
MKRIYLLFFLLAAGTLSAFAQREVDLKASFASPVAGYQMPAGGTFSIDVVIQNLGKDSLKKADSISYYFTLNGIPQQVPIGGQQGVFWITWNRPLKVNDTTHIKLPGLKPNYKSQADSVKELCINILPYRDVVGDTIKDPSTANNKSCVSFTWKANPTGINDVNITEGFTNTAKLYPNPAKTNANIEIDMAYTGDVSIKVMDLSGRVVFSDNKRNVAEGKHSIPFSTATLPDGLYIYSINMGNENTSGKLMIAK